MNVHAFTEEGLVLLLNSGAATEEMKAEIEEAMQYFKMADDITIQTVHEFACREGKLCDLLAEMEEYMKEEERKLVINSVKNVATGVMWLFKGTYILGETAVKGTGKGLSTVFGKIKPKSSKQSDTDLELEKLRLKVRLKELELQEKNK